MSDIKSVSTIGSVSYCNAIISKFFFPKNLSDFKTQFISQFGLKNQIKVDDISSIKYEDKEISNDTEYNEVLEHISGKKKSTVFVETSKVPVHFEGDKSIEFEEGIMKLVENEFKVAANNIKAGLTKYSCLSNCKKIRTEICFNCQQQIFGYLYKKISGNDKDEYFCELCSTQVKEPMFIIY